MNGFPVPKVALISSGESTIAAAIAEIVPARRIIAAVLPLARMGRPFSKSDSLTIDLILVAAVRAAGIEWRDYDHFMQQWIKTADSSKLTRVPANLDLAPYLDENDGELIKVMQRAMKA